MIKKLIITNTVYIMITALIFLGSILGFITDSAFAQQDTTAGPASPPTIFLPRAFPEGFTPPSTVPGQPAMPTPTEPVAPGQPSVPITAPPISAAPAPAAPDQPLAPTTAAPVTAAPAPTTPGQPSAPKAAAPVTAAPAPATPGSMPQSSQMPKPAPAAAVPAQPRTTPSVGGSSFFFDDADVFEVIQTVFGEVLRVNYIIDPSVKGRVNFRTITPIPRDKILSIMEIILRLNGIAVVEESGLYRIIPIGNISKEPAPIRFGRDPESVDLKGIALLQVVPLTYINSSEMAAILTPLLTQGGAIHDISKKNILIIADTDANVRRLLQVVAMFDVDTYKDASQPKVYVYSLQNSKAEHVAKILQQVLLGGGGAAASSSTSGVKTTTGAGAAAPSAPQPGPTGSSQPFKPAGSTEPLVAPSTKIIPDEVANSLVIFASPADYSVIIGAIKQIDTMPRQVMIEAVVAEVDLTNNLTFGLLWNLNVDAHKLKLAPFSKPITAGGPLGFQALSAVTQGAFGYTAVDSAGNVRLAIEADATNGKAKILSSPNILVADNREARIQVGSQIPIATSTTSTPIVTSGTTAATAITNTTTSTIQYKDVGTILKVKPQVNDSGLISLEISQEVSDFNQQTILGTQQFIITKNEVSTNLIAQDGETIVIGGLVNEKKNDSSSGIPYLSNLPVVGALFGQTTHTSNRTELLILLTPHVLRNQDEAKKLTFDFYDLFKNVGREVNLEQHKSTKTPKESSEKTAPQSKVKSADEGPVDAKSDGMATAPASPTNVPKTSGEKKVRTGYPLSSEDN